MSARRSSDNVVGLTHAARQSRRCACSSRPGAVAAAQPMQHASRGASRKALRRSVGRAVLGQTSVREIEHTVKARAKTSCDLICLRVKSLNRFSCSIRWSNKRRSVTELNPDSQSRQPPFKNKGRQHSEAYRSCEFAPADNSRSFFSALLLEQPPRFLANAGSLPAFDHARLSLASTELARRAEFISVSGPRAARSALRSDLRLKRTSGVEAATPQLHAPMNSPDARTRHYGRNRVSINPDAIA